MKTKISLITLIACAAAGTAFAADPVVAFRASSGATTNSSDATHVGDSDWGAAINKSIGETYYADLWRKYAGSTFSWDAFMKAFVSGTYQDDDPTHHGKYYNALNVVLALDGTAQFTNAAGALLTFSYEGDTAGKYSGYSESKGEYFGVDAENMIFIAGSSKFSNEGIIQFESEFTGQNSGTPPGFNVFLRNNAVFENAGTISASPNNSVEYVLVNLFENAKFVNAEGGNIKGMELCLYGNSTFENAGTLDNSLTPEVYITLNESAKLVNTGILNSPKYNFEVEGSASSANIAKIENRGTMTGADVDFRLGATRPGISATFENHGSIACDSFGSIKFFAKVDLDRDDYSSQAQVAAAYKATLAKSNLNVKNYGTIDLNNTGSIVGVGTGVKLSLVEGSSITGGNVSVGIGGESGWGERFFVEKDVLNIELTGRGGNDPLISENLDLCNRVELNVSFAEDAVKKTKYVLTIWGGELLTNEYYAVVGQSGSSDAGFIESSLSGTLSKFGTTYEWALNTATGVLTAKDVNIGEEVAIASGSQNVTLGSKDVATFDASLSEYSGSLAGSGEVHSESNLTFTGDAGSLTGTLSVDAGTMTVAAGANLGSSATLDVAGTLALNGDRTVANATRGNGAIELSSGSDVKFTKSVGVKTLNVNAGATLNGGVSLTHGADAELNLAGTLVLNADAGEKVSLGGGKVVLASSANLDLGGTTTRRIAADESALESGARVTIFENGSVEGDARAFLATDPTLSALAASNVVLFDASNGLTVQALTNPETLSGGVNTSGLSASFVDWALGGLADELASLSAGFTDASTLGALGGSDPLLNALLSGESGTARAILDRLSPKSFAAMIAMPVEAFHGDARSAAARLEQRRYDADKSGWEFFAQAQMTSAENDTATDAPTFDFDTYGVLAGADAKLDAETTLGFAVGAGTGEAKVHDSGGKIESTDFRALVYLGKTFANRFYVNAGAQLGYASYDVKRTTDYGSTKGDADGWNAGVFAEAGTLLTISDANGLYAMPYVGLAYTHAATDSFTESGNERAAFDADSLSGDSLRARVGCEFSWSFDVAGTAARLGLDVAYSRELLDDEIDVDVTATDDGSKISEKAQTTPTDVFSIGPTLDVALTKSASVYAGYAFEAGTDSSTTYRANVGFRMRF